MKNKLYKLLIILFVFSISPSYLIGQFTFGAVGSVGLYQIERDNLKGFNKLSYELGISGGYELSVSNQLIFQLTTSHFGSSRNNERTPSNPSKNLVELSMNTSSIFIGHSKYLGSGWDESYNYRFLYGLKMHRVYDSVMKLYNKNGVSYFEDPFDWTFVSLRFGFGAILNKHFTLDLMYEHAILDVNFQSNLEQVSNLIPFGLSLNLSYTL